MNRKIEFRAWYKKDHQMLSWFDLTQSAWNTFRGNEPLSLLYEILVARKDDFITMQFTGLHDKNGTKIFEGDILSHKWLVLVYQNDEGTYMVKFHTHPELNKPMYLKKYLSHRGKAGTADRDCIVIGNIHQHAHLLNSK